tara:strand:- start:4543 stop:4938 length:396 start_codon:yes stop_codon:yes gene_type:complete
MAATVQTIGTALGNKLVTDELETNAQGVAPKSLNITGAAAVVLMVEVDNTGNTHEIHYKMADATAVAIGSLAPDMQVRVPASSRQTVAFGDADGQTGVPFSSGFSHWVVKEAGLAGETGPDSKVTVKVLVS